LHPYSFLKALKSPRGTNNYIKSSIALFFSKLTNDGFNNNDNGNCWTAFRYRYRRSDGDNIRNAIIGVTRNTISKGIWAEIIRDVLKRCIR